MNRRTFLSTAVLAVCALVVPKTEATLSVVIDPTFGIKPGDTVLILGRHKSGKTLFCQYLEKNLITQGHAYVRQDGQDQGSHAFSGAFSSNPKYPRFRLNDAYKFREGFPPAFPGQKRAVRILVCNYLNVENTLLRKARHIFVTHRGGSCEGFTYVSGDAHQRSCEGGPLFYRQFLFDGHTAQFLRGASPLQTPFHWVRT